MSALRKGKRRGKAPSRKAMRRRGGQLVKRVAMALDGYTVGLLRAVAVKRYFENLFDQLQARYR